MEQSSCERIADIANRIGRRFRLKLREHPEPEPWCPWLIAPATGYLETGTNGPWPERAIEWVEVGLAGTDATAIIKAFVTAGLSAEILDGSVRVTCPK